MKTPMDRDVSDAGVGEEGGRRGLTRRDVLIKGAIVSGAVWVAPVVESFTSPAAAQSTGFSCSAVFIYYVHNNGIVSLIYFANGGATCSTKGGVFPCTTFPSFSCPAFPGTSSTQENNFTMAAGGSATAFPPASATLVNPVTSTTNPVVGAPGTGACSGQFRVSSNVISTGYPSNTIVAAVGVTSFGTCGFACPTAITTKNSVNISNICSIPAA